MSLDAAGVLAILDAVQTHAAASGLFDAVSMHEPKVAPGNGLTAAVWVAGIGPTSAASPLNRTTGRIELSVRIYRSMLSRPEDETEVLLLSAAVTLMAAYSGDFELGGLVRNVDLLGAHGPGLGAQAGYLNQDGKLFRVYVITLPLIVNDIWNQVA